MTELSAPLVRRKARLARTAQAKAAGKARHVPVARIALGLVALIAIGVGARIMLVSDPEGGRPSSTVDIAGANPSNSVAGAVSMPGGSATITADPEMFPVAPAATTTEASTAPIIDPTALDPELTTVDNRFFDLGAELTTGLLSIIDGSSESIAVTIRPPLVLRKSHRTP